MITLYQFQPALGCYNASPFCLKLETYLRMAALPYEVAADANVLKAPKKKLPYIQDGDLTIADSGFALEYLKETYGDPLDEGLSLPEQAIALSFRRLMEENLYWAMIYSRWAEEENWQVIHGLFFSDLPPVLRTLISRKVRKDTLEKVKAHGIGCHTREEIYQIGKRDIKAVGDFLRDKPFLMGDRATSLDATGYGFVANLIRATLQTELSDYAKQFENLTAYCDRMENTYWK
ncbi:MAG: glutathione S-transferase family protein [Cyanobacteria bacterium P01_C01_bin.69]